LKFAGFFVKNTVKSDMYLKFVVQNWNAVPKNIKILQDVARRKEGPRTVVHLLLSYAGRGEDMIAPAIIGWGWRVFSRGKERGTDVGGEPMYGRGWKGMEGDGYRREGHEQAVCR
jgi:hypothetical protein